jgi:hypothetical protein
MLGDIGEYIIGFILGVASGAWLAWSRRQRVRFALAAAGGIAVVLVGSLVIAAVSEHRRTIAPTALEVEMDVRGPSDRLWTPETYADPGDSVEFLLTIRNVGPGRADGLIAAVNKPPGTRFVCLSASIRNGANPNGRRIYSTEKRESCGGGGLFAGGYRIGNYEPKAVAYVSWKEVLPDARSGDVLRAVGIARAVGKTNDVYNTAIVRVR